MSGWIAISRDLFEHDFFAREPMSEREAWVWMLAKAAWKDTTHRIGSEVVSVPRGSFFCTLRELQSAWGWASDKRVRSFLKRTQDGRMADASAAHGKTHVTICNYDEYQHDGRSADASDTTDRTQNGRTKETINTKQEQKKEEDTNVSLSPRPDLSPCIAHFNAVAVRVGWAQVQRFTADRKTALSRRISDIGGQAEWCEAIDRAARSPLLTGNNDRGWKADFDWLANPKNFTKLMEGNYDPRTANQPANGNFTRGGNSTFDAFAAVASRLQN